MDPLGDVHPTLEDGTKVWLSEVARWLPRVRQFGFVEDEISPVK
jgi:hypothetical protein